MKAISVAGWQCNQPLLLHGSWLQRGENAAYLVAWLAYGWQRSCGVASNGVVMASMWLLANVKIVINNCNVMASQSQC